MTNNEPIEYRVIFHWGTHWTCIFMGETPVDIYHYIQTNLAEMQDAVDDDTENDFSIEMYSYGDLEHTWQGTPEDLFKAFKEITDEWLSHAFE